MNFYLNLKLKLLWRAWAVSTGKKKKFSCSNFLGVLRKVMYSYLALVSCHNNLLPLIAGTQMNHREHFRPSSTVTSLEFFFSSRNSVFLHPPDAHLICWLYIVPWLDIPSWKLIHFLYGVFCVITSKWNGFLASSCSRMPSMKLLRKTMVLYIT